MLASIAELEKTSSPNYRSMVIWHNVDKCTRGDTLNKMYNICTVNGLALDTFFLATNLLERVRPSKLKLNNANIHLYSLVALFTASKFYDVTYLRLKNFVLLYEVELPTDDKKKQIVSAEKTFLSAIDYNLNVPTVYTWLSLWFSRFRPEQVKRLQSLSTFLAVQYVQTCTPYFFCTKPVIQAKSVLHFSMSILRRHPLRKFEHKLIHHLLKRLLYTKPLLNDPKVLWNLVLKWVANMKLKKKYLLMV